jgi:hypothetical protein
MSAPTSGTEHRVIENTGSFEEKTMLMAQEPFVTAELGYRLSRAERQFSRQSGRRRHRVSGRPWLHLPHPRRRPLALA